MSKAMHARLCRFSWKGQCCPTP